MQIIDGRKLAADIRTRLKEKIAADGGTPHLAVVLAGDDEASLIYDRNKKKAAEEERNRTGQLIYTPKFDIVSIIMYFLKKPVSAFDSVVLEKETAGELQRIIREYISYYFDIGNLKSEGIITGQTVTC